MVAPEPRILAGRVHTPHRMALADPDLAEERRRLVRTREHTDPDRVVGRTKGGAGHSRW